MTVLLLLTIQITIFGVLILILKGVIRRHFSEASSRLETLTKESENRLTEAKKRVKEADAYYDETFAKVKSDAEKVRQQLIDEGVKEKQGHLERARKESEMIMERARSASKLLEENWNQELTGKAREVTFQVLKTSLPEKVHQSLQSEWVRESLESDFNGLSQLNIPEDVNRVEIVSAAPLSEVHKRTLIGKLHAKIGRSVEISEKVDETLILGFYLSLGSVVIDSSLAWKLKETLRNEKFRKNH
ncbi:MAG: F0F1 ATP synthase subunit delta [Candidatus Omnitrophota bacterium]